MIAVTFQSATAYLLDDAPDWMTAVELSASVPMDAQHGLGAREERRGLGDTLRLGLRYEIDLDAAALSALRNCLQALRAEKVLCPLWPAPIEAGDLPEWVEASYYVAAGDGEAAEILEYAALPHATRTVYPLLVGRLDRLPEPELMTDELARASIAFVEDDRLAVTLAGFTAPTGLADGGGTTRPLWAWRANWKVAPKSGGAETEIDRQPIGQLRSQSSAAYDQRSIRTASVTVMLDDGAAPWQLLRFFQDAAVAPFWAPLALAEARLTHDAAANATFLRVDNLTARGSNACLLLDDNVRRAAVKVTSNTAPDRWNLAAAPGAAFAAGWTRIESLALCRFARADLTIRFTEPWLSEAEVEFRETPWETAAVTGETFGTTLGALPVAARLYVFTLAYPGSTTTLRYTDFERDLTADGLTYGIAPFEFDTIKESLNLERTNLQLKSRHFAGNPLSLLLTPLEVPLALEIYECAVDGDAATDLLRLFSGQVRSAQFDGPFISAECATLAGVFDRKFPRQIVQPNCNWTLGETLCGATVPTWTGTVLAYDDETMALSLSGPASGLVAHYFAGGWLQIGTGATAQRRIIADSLAQSAGNLTITLGGFLGSAPAVGTSCVLRPGCDGSPQTCTDRFGNYARFGGFPHVPIGNPSAAEVKSNTGSGKK